MLQNIKEFDEAFKDLINRELSSYNFLDLYVVQNLDLINYTAEIKGLNNNNKFVSVPLSSSLLGHGKGLLIPPEVNDVVLVGFLNGRKSSPVILGCIFNNFMNSSDTVLDIRSGELFLSPKLNGSYFFIDENGNIKLQTTDGSIFLNGLKLPSGTGQLNQILVADGDGNLVWSSGSAGGLYSFEYPFYLDGLHVYLDYTDKFVLDGSSLDLNYSKIDHNSLYNYASERHFLTTEIDRLDTSLATGFVRVENGTGFLSSDTTVYEPVLPTTPENPETKFLNGNREWAQIAIGAGGFAGNLYFTTIASDVSGYYKISYEVEASQTELPRTVKSSEGDKLFATYLYDYALDTDTIDAGVWVANYQVKVSNAVQETMIKMEVFVRHSDTTETTLWSDYSPKLNNTDYVTIRSETNQPSFTVATTDRLGVRIYGNTTSVSNITITTVVGDGDGSYFTTPLRIRHDQLRDLDAENSHPCEAISINKLGTPTWTNQCHINNLFGSAGRATGGVITDAGGGTVDVSAGTGFIKSTDSDTDTLYSFNWDASLGITIPADSTRYIGVDYNSGTPIIVSHTSYDWNFDTNFPLGTVLNETINGTSYLYVGNNPWWVTDGMTNLIQALFSFGIVRRDNYIGGLILSVTGTRNIAVSAGKVWVGLIDYAYGGIDTSVSGTVEGYWYSSTSGWQKNDLTQYSITQYNDVTQATLQTINNNKYCNIWVYGELDEGTPGVALIYPQAQYNTAAEAEAIGAPNTLPNHISNYGILLGKIIIKQGVDIPIAVESAFSTVFTPSLATDHGNLSGLQGGVSGEYYHLSSSDYSKISNWDDAYNKRVDTWGDGLSYNTQIVSIDYNTTNLKITANQLDTIQSIAPTASPTFAYGSKIGDSATNLIIDDYEFELFGNTQTMPILKFTSNFINSSRIGLINKGLIIVGDMTETELDIPELTYVSRDFSTTPVYAKMSWNPADNSFNFISEEFIDGAPSERQNLKINFFGTNSSATFEEVTLPMNLGAGLTDYCFQALKFNSNFAAPYAGVIDKGLIIFGGISEAYAGTAELTFVSHDFATDMLAMNITYDPSDSELNILLNHILTGPKDLTVNFTQGDVNILNGDLNITNGKLNLRNTNTSIYSSGDGEFALKATTSMALDCDTIYLRNADLTQVLQAGVNTFWIKSNVYMNNNTPFYIRNAADDAWLELLKIDASNVLQIGAGATSVNIPKNVTVNELNCLGAFSVYSSEVGFTDWRLTINTNNADEIKIYAYDEGEATFKDFYLGNNTLSACVKVGADGSLSSKSLTVDNITIDGAIISSNTGAISFDNENLTTTGILTAGSLKSNGQINVGASGNNLKLNAPEASRLTVLTNADQYCRVGVATPTAAEDATTKAYVDTATIIYAYAFPYYLGTWTETSYYSHGWTIPRNAIAGYGIGASFEVPHTGSYKIRMWYCLSNSNMEMDLGGGWYCNNTHNNSALSWDKLSNNSTGATIVEGVVKDRKQFIESPAVTLDASYPCFVAWEANNEAWVTANGVIVYGFELVPQ